MFMGVDGVIVNRKDACGLTPTVSKVSSGALEFLPLYQAKYVSLFLQDAKEGPFKFKIISTNISEESTDLQNDEIEDEKPSSAETKDFATADRDLDLPPSSDQAGEAPLISLEEL